MGRIDMSRSVASTETLTFEEYRFYQGEPDVLYELFRGHLIPMATPTALHTRICDFLVYQLKFYFANQNLPLIAITTTGVRTEVDSSRIPDVVVCTTELWEQACARPGSGILDLGEVPTLVVEVTSDNWREDYIRKRAEYALIDIAEYWIVDPNKERVWLLSHPEGEEGYQREEFTRGQELKSIQFPELVLSVDAVLSPPLVEDLIREEQSQKRQLEQQVDEARQQADEARQRAERLATRLREMGVDPDTI
ncbi:MAG: Uma2 family endonuclease [Microcoleus sp. SIO2G3]|nr:Uma2 family endonuclease [Microcoleus sp. SIO2G3]